MSPRDIETLRYFLHGLISQFTLPEVLAEVLDRLAEACNEQRLNDEEFEQQWDSLIVSLDEATESR